MEIDPNISTHNDDFRDWGYQACEPITNYKPSVMFHPIGNDSLYNDSFHHPPEECYKNKFRRNKVGVEANRYGQEKETTYNHLSNWTRPEFTTTGYHKLDGTINGTLPKAAGGEELEESRRAVSRLNALGDAAIAKTVGYRSTLKIGEDSLEKASGYKVDFAIDFKEATSLNNRPQLKH